MDIDANEEGIQTYGDYGPTTEIKIQNSHVPFYSEEEEGIYLASGSVIIIDSTLDIDADEEGIQAYDNYGPAELKILDSDVSIRSNDEEGVDIYGPLSITGGQLKVAASEMPWRPSRHFSPTYCLTWSPMATISWWIWTAPQASRCPATSSCMTARKPSSTKAVGAAICWTASRISGQWHFGKTCGLH